MDESFLTGEKIQEIITQKKEPDWLINKRLDALNLFLNTPLPNKKEEEWRYANLVGLNLDKIDLSASKLLQKNSNNLKKQGIVITTIEKGLTEYEDIFKKYFMTLANPKENKFLALHFALWDKGIFVYVPEGVESKIPIHSSFFTNYSSGVFLHSLIIVENNARLDYIEKHISPFKDNQAVHTEVVETFIKDNSEVNFLNLQSWGLNVYNFATKRASVGRNSMLNWNFGLFGGKFTKLNLDMYLDGEGAVVKNYGVYFGIQNQHFNIHTNAYHNVPNTSYDILSKGVLLDNAATTHRGLIKISKNAPQTKAMLRGHTLLLSEQAQSNIVPALEIDNNDVVAGHEATVGQVDELQLFYLMCRGITRKDAEKLIVQGYFEPILRSISFESFKEDIQRLINERIRSV